MKIKIYCKIQNLFFQRYKIKINPNLNFVHSITHKTKSNPKIDKSLKKRPKFIKFWILLGSKHIKKTEQIYKDYCFNFNLTSLRLIIHIKNWL